MEEFTTMVFEESGASNQPTTDWLAVLGMHRSGTSAVTEILSKLGLALPPDLLSADEFNPHGYFESTTLIEVNDRLLRSIGATVWGPPRGESEFGELEAEYAESEFGAICETIGTVWVWKDPRLSLTLPFWRKVASPNAAVLCWRDVSEVVASLERRYGMPNELAVALWQRYNQAALEACRDLPTLVVDATLIRRNPLRVVSDLSNLLLATWPNMSIQPASEVVSSVNRGLLTTSCLPDFELETGASATSATLRSITGFHKALPTVRVPELSERGMLAIDVSRNTDVRRVDIEMYFKPLVAQPRVRTLLDSDLGVKDIQKLIKLKNVITRIPLIRTIVKRLLPNG